MKYEQLWEKIENKAYGVNHLFGHDYVISLDALKEVLTAAPAEDEPTFSWSNTYQLLRVEFPELDQTYTAHICDQILEGLETDNQITLRKIEEYLKQFKYYPYADGPDIDKLKYWLRQEDK